ncbi:MAG: ribonuclease R [Deltaproteobacteria bacterium]|nr:MAG: ribonuclease R [Deltaproteobacteria bacterium]
MKSGKSKKMIVKGFSQGIDDIIEEFEIPNEFPKKVLEESQKLMPPDDAEFSKRQDLRDELIVTIDGETAKDFDDAVGISRMPEGGFRLKVSIADVSHYVLPGTTLDHEAYYRGNSAYFADRCIPMLPEKLSNDLCSLVPHQPRLTLTADMVFNEKGIRVSETFYPSVIKSVARLTYTEVSRVLVDRDESLRKKYANILSTLEDMSALAHLLMKMRSTRGSIDFDLPESQIVFGAMSGGEENATDDLEEVGIQNIVKAERNVAHRLIEEFMIAANEAVAEFILFKNISSLYRIHNPPDNDRVKDFALLLHNLGYQYSLRKPSDPKTFAGVLPLVKGKPEERLVNTILLRTMNRAVYSASNDGHFGLASECYTHFTSPIRRYPDLVVHRALKQALGLIKVKQAGPKTPKREKKNQKKRDEAMERVAHHCSDTERSAMKAEWASRDLAACIFMRDKVGQEFSGIVSNLTKFGIFVEFDDFFLEGLVPLRLLTDDHYVFHEKAHVMTGRKTKKRIQVGNRVRVKVLNINLDKRWIDLVLI